jgi:two-component system, cell cycle sensor histidine kinase and response regulator CckA
MILLIEDEAISRTHFAEILRGHGYEVLEAGDGVQALALIVQHRPDIDLVITDMVMPGMNGIPLVENIELMLPRVPIIMVSAYLSKTSGKAILNRVVDFLEKPIRPSALVAAVQRYARPAAPQRDNDRRWIQKVRLIFSQR